MNKILIKNATVLTVNNKSEIFENTDILIESGIITKIEKNITDTAEKIVFADKKVVMPGFIQTHLHLCQTLFRGMAENRFLLNWLRDKIWPFESLHTEESMYNSAMLGIGELVSSGTTCILDMGSVNHTNQIFEALTETGIRALAGKALMDSGKDVPENLLDSTEKSISESLELYEKWNNSSNGRIKYAFAPRFILSCSDLLFDELSVVANKHEIPVHTHCYENKSEGKEVIELRGKREFDYFLDKGLMNERFLAAHCVWTNEKDIEILKQTKAKVLHCPCSNFKLGSGMLNLKTLIDNNISVSLAADGAPCNNNLDMFQEIRTTALMQNVINKPGDINAHKYLELATIEGAKALGIDKETGSVEVGKKADLIILDLECEFHHFNSDSVDLATRVVYSAKSTDVKTVVIDGKIVMEDRILKTIDKDAVIQNCKKSVKNFL